MSKMNGGLGFSYIDVMGCHHVDTGQYNVAYADGQRCRMPRYYKTQFRKNNPLYAIQTEKSKNDYLDRLIIENQRKFEQFAKKYSDDLTATTEFNKAQRENMSRAEDLILKHCTKQKL